MLFREQIRIKITDFIHYVKRQTEMAENWIDFAVWLNRINPESDCLAFLLQFICSRLHRDLYWNCISLEISYSVFVRLKPLIPLPMQCNAILLLGIQLHWFFIADVRLCIYMTFILLSSRFSPLWVNFSVGKLPHHKSHVNFCKSSQK